MLTCVFEDGGKASLRHVVVDAIVEREGRILLVKRAPQYVEGGKWALPGGYLSRDEHAAQAVLRELYEETGWQGVDPRLFRISSNPNRPHEDRQNVVFIFSVTPTKKVGTPDAESTDIQWVAIEDLHLDDLAFDHGESIKLYVDYKKNPFALPLFS